MTTSTTVVQSNDGIRPAWRWETTNDQTGQIVAHGDWHHPTSDKADDLRAAALAALKEMMTLAL